MAAVYCAGLLLFMRSSAHSSSRRWQNAPGARASVSSGARNRQDASLSDPRMNQNKLLTFSVCNFSIHPCITHIFSQHFILKKLLSTLLSGMGDYSAIQSSHFYRSRISLIQINTNFPWNWVTLYSRLPYLSVSMLKLVKETLFCLYISMVIYNSCWWKLNLQKRQQRILSGCSRTPNDRLPGGSRFLNEISRAYHGNVK
jgi:hypothetical protein